MSESSNTRDIAHPSGDLDQQGISGAQGRPRALFLIQAKFHLRVWTYPAAEAMWDMKALLLGPADSRESAISTRTRKTLITFTLHRTRKSLREQNTNKQHFSECRDGACQSRAEELGAVTPPGGDYSNSLRRPTGAQFK